MTHDPVCPEQGGPTSSSLLPVNQTLNRQEYTSQTLGQVEQHKATPTKAPLAQVPILFALSEAQLFELARCMGSATFTAGQLVFAKGDPGKGP